MPLSDAVGVLPGVGPKRVEALADLGIVTVNDLLFYFPFRYDDLQERDLATAVDGEKLTVKGTVVADPVIARFGPHKVRVTVRLQVDRTVILVSFFNQPWLKDRFHQGQEAAIYGKWNVGRNALSAMRLVATKDQDAPSMAAIYPLSQAVHQKFLVDTIKVAYEHYADEIKSVVPEQYRTRLQLLTDRELVRQMHFPANPAEAAAARRSAIFREFFLFEVQLQAIKQRDTAQVNGLRIPFDNHKVRAFIQTLPFELTAAQKRVVNEICADMLSTKHMNRLLQGDVGSGKTIVAAICMYAAVTAHFQAALMVPTEVLAEQHFAKLSQLFEPVHVSVALLTGATSAADRKVILERLRSGDLDIAIGTHALIQKGVDFNALGFAIIDEQHRFGVKQREVLRAKGLKPDVLSMTATPIPRTLAITAYGEMDVSTIDEMPAGRLPVRTLWLHKQQQGRAVRMVEEAVAAGGQAFVITPLIAESEAVDLKNAEAVYAEMQETFASKAAVALLHGRMKPDEKDAIMRDFASGQTAVLVSTTVIEVGVDVPNATMMMILDADRFGLAQLHQLRGRVGRGRKQATCILIADPKSDSGVSRMETMVDTNDGFKVAQRDLELRGQGDIFGAKQSGLPDFRLGDPVGDFNILDTANKVASTIFTDDPGLETPGNAVLSRYLNGRLAQAESLN
ncbi:ATP-dependent DNA helicase RecG [Lacticaseibacillus pantheris]|uniref:ATP-dependent DNA helicase RecG n=1 Tax=Lacticaseibacillus pantheris TaxID=171523 RepID=UPI00070521A7|nr:ATP-dependent DNA helicase RecG [Lacticaseibacillus pantheris]